MASSGPSGLEGVFLIAFEQAESEVITVAHDGADEPNYGKAVMEREENLGLGMVDRSEIQVLTGVNRHHGHTLGIRETSAEGDTKGYHSH